MESRHIDLLVLQQRARLRVGAFAEDHVRLYAAEKHHSLVAGAVGGVGRAVHESIIDLQRIVARSFHSSRCEHPGCSPTARVTASGYDVMARRTSGGLERRLSNPQTPAAGRLPTPLLAPRAGAASGAGFPARDSRAASISMRTESRASQGRGCGLAVAPRAAWPGGQLLQRIRYNRTQPQPRAVPGSLHQCRLRTEWYQTVSSIFGSMLRTVSQERLDFIVDTLCGIRVPEVLCGNPQKATCPDCLAALRHRGVR